MQNARHMKSKRRNHSSGLRQLFCVFVSLVLLVAHSLPVAAGFGESSSGGWIEICGEYGVTTIQLDEGSPYDTTEHESDCTHCPFCLVPFNTSVASFAPNLAVQISSDFTKVTFAAAQTVQPAAPVQYWSTCRGPPITNTEKNMTTHSMPAHALAQAISVTWGISCS